MFFNVFSLHLLLFFFKNKLIIKKDIPLFNSQKPVDQSQ